MYNDITISRNTVSDSGGGIYLYRSELNCQDESTVEFLSNGAIERGGGIHAINSFITVFFNRSSFMDGLKSSVNFTNNTAQMGGGVYLETTAEIRIIKKGDYLDDLNMDKMINVFFTKNSASQGGAIYVDDETNFEICTGRSDERIDCFLQVLSPQKTGNYNYDLISIEFIQNNGSTLYGGLLDRCTLSPLAEILILHPTVTNGVSYITTISNISTDNISSAPVQLCFCRQSGQADCNYQPDTIQVKKGERFTLSLVAVDQVNHTVANAMVFSSLSNTESGLGQGQMTQITKNTCTDLTFNVYSPHPSEELILYAKGPCKDAGMSQSRVSVMFLNCTCPVGFQPKGSEERKDCECVCDSKLSPYITNPDCNPDTETLTRNGHFWVIYLNNTDTTGHYNYLIHPHCPLDYCHSPDSKVQINLNIEKGSDMQCSNNRSGLLCGVCQPGLSPSLGSSQCIVCPKAGYFVIFLVALVIAGIALVALLLILNLTVAVGTLNGLIFYANIINANNSTFLPSSSTKFLSVFISVLSLDLGIDTCFEGMDTYWKTWLQLSFPIYVILLVVMVIVISHYSIRFSRLIGKKNPVATLATLILFSYTRMLHSIITVLSFAKMDYPDGSHVRVWLPDATVKYLNGKHAALFVVAILILAVGIGYTFLLFFWQWILHHQQKRLFMWVRYQRLCHFIEPYHAPYIFKYRYWTGLLLLVRVALYLTIALNLSGDPGVNLLAIVVVTSCLIFLKGFFGRIYKNWVVEITEMIFYLNMALFSAAVLYTLEAEKDCTLFIFISGAITLALFLVVLIYHIFTEFFQKLWKKYNQRERENSIELFHRPTDSDQTDPPEPTYSIIDAFFHEGSENNEEHGGSNPLQFGDNSSDEEDRSSAVSASSAPLLDEDLG